MLVSVIIPCYNQGNFLNETLESVYKQTYSDWECIIVDDGSIDNTMEIAQSWVSNDKRFKYYNKENGGVSSARNYGIELAQGEFLQFLDSDDILDMKKIEISINLLKLPKNSEVQMVISNFKMISSDSKEFYPAFCELTYESLSFENFLYNFFSIQIQCGFFDVKLFESIKFPENLSAQEDWVVWVHLFKNKPNYIFKNLPLAYYRINPTGRMMTMGADDNQIKVLDSLKEILTYHQYHQFSVHLMSKYYDSTKLFRNNLTLVKTSNTYKAGLIIKKVLNKVGMLKLAKEIFKKILKFKTR
ncbi:glycosyltransferase family 2 protein [Flavobacterium sp. K5-23]|uniref:glycosyltransferase family 2 protein n=1 Tax=Flavobacterium sp. K5-23 TaxID=2746225 RepID=UPI00200C8B43|nr:glycosyltransferase family 2 protein [Flavobacterium sp. K5-23]UQD56150.1 glycosyltransferase family 2 protein [Flavobacterium sp. K5-23]